MKRICKEIKDFLACAVIGVLIGLGFGYACARDIDKDFERECGKTWDDNGTELCKEYWNANGIHG